MKAYYVIRKDLNMSAPQLAIQVGHGSCLLYELIKDGSIDDWFTNHEMKKVIVQVKDYGQLDKVYNRLICFDSCPLYIYDYSKKQPVTTGFVILCDDSNSNDIYNVVKRLKLYK